MYEVKLGWKWCTPRFQRTRRRESLSTDQVMYKNKINQCMGESSFGLDPNYFMVWCGILDGILLVKCGGGRGWTIERCVIIYENTDLRNKLPENCTSFSGKKCPTLCVLICLWGERAVKPLLVVWLYASKGRRLVHLDEPQILGSWISLKVEGQTIFNQLLSCLPLIHTKS